MGDFPPKARGPVSWLPGGSRLCPLLQLAADWEVIRVIPFPFRSAKMLSCKDQSL
uniref:Uncharacterized protein n=1 Tax=Hyaloperonospora arabidopsidis (strain Emoy2) TaxID=559515 RepID=M4BZ36_HYAAE